ncbi:MAG: serine/threonine protein kinase [Polyangiaceae bacterium]
MSDANIGRVLARKYELMRLIGRGGMGAVYEGRNQIGKRVAIKLLLTPEIVASTDLTARFFREAEASAAIESTHVVDVYDTGVDEESGLPFLIMAYLQGEDLERLVERVGPLNPVAAVRIGVQAATGLAKAHEVGIIHRDIKPANIFLATSEGDHVVKLLDFGIAKVTTERLSQSGAGPQALTSTGALLGTPLYMSPEQAQGLKNIDARTDVWSLGMCLYQSLAGKLPFGEVDTIGKLIVAIVSHEIPPLAELAPWVPKDLASVVQRTLERDLDKRIASARDLISELTPFLSGGQALPSSILVGVKESLDLTLAPGSLVAAPSVPGGSAGGPGSAPRLYATTAGISSDRRSGGAKPKRALGAVVALGVVATLVGGAVALKLASHPSEAGLAAVPAPPTPAVEPSAAQPPHALADETRVGALSLKMPDGYTVTVDGAAPGGPDSTGDARLLAGGRLELRGEFQRKFLVAVFDPKGKRVFVQDVYLYDNKLDPDSIDTLVGAVPIEKPKHKPAIAPRGPQPPPAPSHGGGDLPARF